MYEPRHTSLVVQKKYNVAVERPPPMIMRPGQAAPRRPDWPGPSVVPSDGRGWAQAYREALLVGGDEPLAIAYACDWRMSSNIVGIPLRTCCSTATLWWRPFA